MSQVLEAMLLGKTENFQKKVIPVNSLLGLASPKFGHRIGNEVLQ
jgi:hypothetical protein